MPSNVCQEAFVIRPDGDMLKRQPGLQHAANALALKYAYNELVTEDELKQIGQKLWQALNLEDVFAQARQRAGANILPIIIESDSAAIQQLPWEILYHPEHGFLGKSPGFALSRKLGADTVAQEKLETGPLRVLLFTSLPDDLDADKARLDVEEEQARVQEALMPWIAKGMIQLEMPDDGRFSTLKQLLRDFAPHLLFLSGHGKFHHQPHSGQPPFGTFLFESESGDCEPIRDTEIAQALIGSQTQCVVVSACESGKAASDALSNGLARQLNQQGIAHVIGMRESMLDRAGTLFSHNLCDAIARRERIDVALQQARMTIATSLKGMSEGYDGGLGELSIGQWCLPTLIQQDSRMLIIDWDFTPSPPIKPTNQSLKTISLPPRFIGRRAELRQLKGRINRGQLQKLLITGPGGQGKTALAGKLAQDLQQRGHEILAWSARANSSWHDFLLELEFQLNEDNAKHYDRMVVRCANETEKAKLLLRLLLDQTQHGIVLFFDNLESIQKPDSLELNDPLIQAWIKAAQGFCDHGLVLLLTSRWQIPGWPDKDHWSLAHASYGDFLQMAQQQDIAPKFYKNRSRLRLVHTTLNGNGRGLAFFAAAIKDMDIEQEQAFLKKLAHVEEETQADMALDVIFENLGAHELELLNRLPAFLTPVPLEGIIKLALDMEKETETLLRRLLAVSLVEKQFDYNWQTYQYQISPLSAEYMESHRMHSPDPQLLGTAAEYQMYLLHNERQTLQQAINTHQALRSAGQKNESDRLALEFIVEELTKRGFYKSLLKDWLPDICESDDKWIKGTALGKIGKQYLYLADYEKALDPLFQSLTIRKEIGDKIGQGAVLNNIASVYREQGDINSSLDYFKQALEIQKQVRNRFGEGTALNNIGSIYRYQGEIDKAIDHLEKALVIHQQHGFKEGECRTLSNLSGIYKDFGDFDKALDYIKRSLAICREINFKAGEGIALGNISVIYAHLGEHNKALDYQMQTLSISQELLDKAMEASALNNISTSYVFLGDYKKAFDNVDKAQTIAKQIGNRACECLALNNKGMIYAALGDTSNAIHFYSESLAMSREFGDKVTEKITLDRISELMSYLSNLLSSQQDTEDKAGEGTTLNNISGAYYARGDYGKALEYLKQSLAIRHQIGDSSGFCTTLFNIGCIHFRKDEVSNAVQTWVTTYRLAKSMNLAQVLEALKNLTEQLNLPDGLDGWEKLSKQMEEGDH